MPRALLAGTNNPRRVWISPSGCVVIISPSWDDAAGRPRLLKSSPPCLSHTLKLHSPQSFPKSPPALAAPGLCAGNSLAVQREVAGGGRVVATRRLLALLN